jgi:hypothetical protein
LTLELSDAAKVAIELYLKETTIANEEIRNKRITRSIAVIGIFAAIIGGLLAWAMTTITAGAKDAATAAATAETHRLLTTDPIVDKINSSLKRADDTTNQAIQSAAASRLAASEAELSLKTLQIDLARSQEVVSAVNKVNDLANAVAKSPGFQDSVVAKTVGALGGGGEYLQS